MKRTETNSPSVGVVQAQLATGGISGIRKQRENTTTILTFTESFQIMLLPGLFP
jgi:hypothetical protein